MKIFTDVNYFVDTNVLVESESDMDQFVALREKRDSMRSQNGDGEDFDSGCGGTWLNVVDCYVVLHCAINVFTKKVYDGT